MKNNRFIVWLLTLSLILSALPFGVGAAKVSESTVTKKATVQDSYGWDVMVTMGQKENTLLFTWTTNGDGDERVEIAEASKMVNGKFPSEYLSFPAVDITSEVSSATASDLKPDTKYCYRLANAYSNYSEIYYVETGKHDSEFSFLLAGDPQIGATGDHVDTIAWDLTLDKAREWFGADVEFLMSAGDQTNNTSLEVQFDGYATPDWFRSLPMISVPGNHDNGYGAIYSKHFVYENVDQATTTEAGIYGGDYWIAYDGVLIMALNMNNLSYSLHTAFMQKAITEYTELYGEPNWKIVTFHQSLFSAADGRWDEASRRNGLAPSMSKLGIDAVLMGHDHVYTRSYMMNGTTPVTDQDRYTEMNGDKYGSIVDPKEGEVFYLTANSSTGSKYYNLYNGHIPYVAYANQEDTPNITKIDVTADSLHFTTYRTSAKNEFDDVVDTFAIRRTTSEDKHAPTITVPEKTYYVANENYDLLKGITAYDNVDGDVTDKIEVSGNLDLFAESVITYTVTDSSGNTTKVQRIMVPYNYQEPVNEESEWKYLDDGSILFENDEDVFWTTSEYDDNAWNHGVGPFGARNGELSEHEDFTPNTLISQYFPEDSEDAGANIPSYYFRRTFDVENPDSVALMGADFYYDDSVLIYINGVLIDGFHANLISNKADYSWQESPSDATPGSFKLISKEYISTLNLKETDNVIAVQLFQVSSYSDDIFFHLNSLYFGNIPQAQTLPFTDVPEDAWYYDSVSRSYNQGLFVGTTDTSFSPNATMTRASVWTVLARIAGADITSKPGEKWYEGARRWAMENNVSDGTNPNNPITREQFAKMLWSMQSEPSSDYCLDGFADETTVSSWAKDGMNWAVSIGLINGRNGTHLAPKANASRAESCTILLRYKDNF
ncbi:MAG: DUF5011 domain-containing protein [Ruminococcaceae bacterium]|nr:DUF5011 domain-containing protein [Oscillospiraceae bacterium]